MARAMRRRPIHSPKALGAPGFARSLEEPASHRRPKVPREGEAGRAQARLLPVSVWDVLEQVLSKLGPSAAGVGIQVALLTPAARGVPPVAADSARLALILMRLGSNAIKFNRAGGSVTFSVQRMGADFVRVSVVDTGVGMAASERDLVFQPAPPRERERGRPQRSDMGLALSRRLAQMMHGAIGFRSLWPRGEEFWLDLPVYS
jgi:signal transduction histidine kinase